MAQGITFDLKARVTGYEDSLNQLKKAFEQIDPGSSIGKKLAKAIEEAEAKLKGLNKNLTPKATSDTQIDNIVEKTNAAGDAIQKVADLLQKVNTEDIDFSVFDNSIKELTQNLANLEKELNNNLSEGIKKVISDSTELNQTFKDLGIDTTDKNVTQIFDAISEKAKTAVSDVEAAKEVLEAAQNDLDAKSNKLAQLQSNPLYNKDELKQDLTNITSEYTKTFDSIKSSIQSGLSGLLTDKKKTDEMMEVFTQGLTPYNLKQHLITLKDTLQTELKGSLSVKDIYTALLGDAGKAGNAQAITTYLNKTLLDIKEQFQGKFQEIISSLTKNEIGQITTLINENDFEGALRASLKAIERGYKTLIGSIEQGKAAVAEATKIRNTAQTNYESADAYRANIDSTVTKLTDELERIKTENQTLREDIERLKNLIIEKKQTTTTQIRDTGASSRTEDYKFTNEEIKKYNEQLDQVHAKEKLVGKIEGLVQRWFSIYAAVRMVNNAVRSVISTVKELDKTITEIAIVTDMTQDDLWKQMSSYTEMARQYAASISGVYQVSQLYYQNIR